MAKYDTLFIDGVQTPAATSNRINVVSAATEEVIGSAPEASTSDVDTAVAAARRAFNDPRGWTNWSPQERAKTIEKFAEELETRSAQITSLVAQQNGMPISTAGILESALPTAVYRLSLIHI